MPAASAARRRASSHGPEPSLRWPAVAAQIVDAARRLGVVDAVTLGGHARAGVAPPARSRARDGDAAARSRRRSAPLRPDYAGPTGTQTIVQHALGAAGIPCVGLWAQVPQYVAGSPSPPAVRALLARLAEVHRVDLDLQALDARSRGVPGPGRRRTRGPPDVKEIVDRLDRERTDAVEGDELVDEIERSCVPNPRSEFDQP